MAINTGFLRVPKHAQTIIGAEKASIKILPAMRDEDFANIQGETFCLRLRDAFQSAEAVVFGERYFVTNAMSHAVHIYIVDCAERDPIMVFVGFKPVADTIPETLQKVKFIALPDLDLEPFGALPADLDQAKQTFSTTRLFAVQLLVASTESFAEDHPVKHVQMQGFKNYRLVPMDPRFPSALAFAKALGDSCVLMPVDAIWNDKYRGQLLTISVNKSSDAVTVARELRATVPFIYSVQKAAFEFFFRLGWIGS